MVSFYAKLQHKNHYRQLRVELGDAIKRYMRATLNLDVDKVYAGFHTDTGYVVFHGDSQKHKVYMSYDWLVTTDTIVIKIVFQNPKVMKIPVPVKLIKNAVGEAVYGQVRTYIILRQAGDEEEALTFIAYNNGNASTRLLAKRNLTSVLSSTLNKATPHQEEQYLLDREYNIYRVGQDNKRYIFTLSTYTDLIDNRVVIKLESDDDNDPNRIITLSMGQSLLTVFKVYSDYVYTDAMRERLF